MSYALSSLKVEGFKSIKQMDLDLHPLNILIGANGSGKSNFIELFRLLRAMMKLPLPGIPGTSLQSYIADGGGSDSFLYLGPKITPQIHVQANFRENSYRFNLVPTSEESFLISDEERYNSEGDSGWWKLGSGHFNPELLREINNSGVKGWQSISRYIYNAISSWQIYHFHDTGKLAPVRRSEQVEDSEYLRFDGANVAPFLFALKTNHPF
ncbi:MAG: AAA family ATPase, partial [Firmicutes bacterium]|nr:AAA family ATPase [Bacillota bacterium]